MHTDRKLRFCFELDAVEDVPAWGEAEERSLHWFGLTSGRYWISTPLGEALRYAHERQNVAKLNSPYVDYYVARLFEDLQVVLPFVLEPVPADIADRTSDREWYARSVRWMEEEGATEERFDLWYGANQWWGDRQLDTGYLVEGPNFYLWRIGDEVFIRWEQGSGEERVWETPCGQFVVHVSEFEAAGRGFLDEVIRQMCDRVRIIATQGWQRADCFLDVKALIEEQQQRTARIEDLKTTRTNTDWAATRRFLDRLEGELSRK